MKLASNEYRILTCWRVRAKPDEVARIASEPDALPRWWPATFLDARRLDRAAELAPGAEIDFHTKGWLPHTFRFRARVQELSYPHHCLVEVSGDFEGQLVCDIRTDGRQCQIRFDWRVKVHKPMVRTLSFLLKPLFYANHFWVMVRGWQSLKLELARRRCAPLDDKLKHVPLY